MALNPSRAMRSPLEPRDSGSVDPGIGWRSGGPPPGPPGSPRLPGAVAAPGAPPAWQGWLQVGLLSMLAVLFLVLFIRSREQHLEMQRLRQRVRVLEASASVDRNAAQSEQLRVMRERVQTVEEILARRLAASERERQRLEQKLLALHTRPQLGRISSPPSEPSQPSAPTGPRLKRTGAALQGGGVLPLRPPANLR